MIVNLKAIVTENVKLVGTMRNRLDRPTDPKCVWFKMDGIFYYHNIDYPRAWNDNTEQLAAAQFVGRVLFKSKIKESMAQ